MIFGRDRARLEALEASAGEQKEQLDGMLSDVFERIGMLNKVTLKLNKQVEKWRERTRELEGSVDVMFAEAEAILLKSQSRENAAKAADARARDKLGKIEAIAGIEGGENGDGVRVRDETQMDAFPDSEDGEGFGDNQPADDFEARARAASMTRGR